MSEALVHRVGSNLRRKFYSVNDSWLEECIQYYTSENTDASLSAVETFVTSQWLLSDLRETNNERGCLPPNFSRQEKISLPGKYIVQIDKMYDISQSKYSQIQKIRNVSEANVKATAIEAPAWEPKGKRMIQMYLTDGVQEFTAIEYRPIRTLKDTLLPGFKIMIVGPAIARKGVIMLEEENYKEIGGEVDALLKVNALENVLARALGMEENEDPYADDDQQHNAAQSDNEFPEDDFDINLDEIVQIERLSMEAREPPVNQFSNTEISGPRNDLPNSKTASMSRENYPSLNGNKKSQGEIANNDEGNSQRRGTAPQHNSLRLVDSDLSPFSEQNRTGRNESNIVPRRELRPMISVPNSSNYQFRDNGVDNSHDCRTEKYSDKPYSSNTFAAAFANDDDNAFDFNDFEDELDEHAFSNKNPVRKSDESLPGKDEEQEKKRFVKSAKNVPEITSKPGNPPVKSPTLSAGKRSADTLSPLGCSTKMICLETTRPQSNSKNRKITEFTEKIIPKEEMPPKICDFICDVVKEPPLESVTYKTVRGRVTQFGKLLKKDNSWELRSTITDGTASLEIMFASQLLEELIGFTVPEFLEKKKLRKTNPEVEQYLKMGFRNAETRVQRMDVLMELELSAENDIPKVINTKELTDEQRNVIDKRMKMMIV